MPRSKLAKKGKYLSSLLLHVYIHFYISAAATQTIEVVDDDESMQGHAEEAMDEDLQPMAEEECDTGEETEVRAAPCYILFSSSNRLFRGKTKKKKKRRGRRGRKKMIPSLHLKHLS